MADHLEVKPSTQTDNPTRATVRTIFALIVGLAAGWAGIVGVLDLDPGLEWVATSLAVAGAVTRLMASPIVDKLIRTYAPWLAPDSGRTAPEATGDDLPASELPPGPLG